jgi:AhpD family alkylhydroperoxidase
VPPWFSGCNAQRVGTFTVPKTFQPVEKGAAGRGAVPRGPLSAAAMSRSGEAAASMSVRGPSWRHRGYGRTTQMQWLAERVQQLDPANAEQAMKTLYGLGRYLEQSGLEHSLLDLMATRASQINGCAYCMDMHTRTRGLVARASSAGTCSMPSAIAPSTASGNARRCSGRRPLRSDCR